MSGVFDTIGNIVEGIVDPVMGGVGKVVDPVTKALDPAMNTITNIGNKVMPYVPPLGAAYLTGAGLTGNLPGALAGTSGGASGGLGSFAGSTPIMSSGYTAPSIAGGGAASSISPLTLANAAKTAWGAVSSGTPTIQAKQAASGQTQDQTKTNTQQSLLDSLGITSPTGGVGSNALPVAALIANLNSQSQASKSQQDSASKLEAMVQPTMDAANQALSQYKSGKLNVADAQSVKDWQAQQKAQIDQYYAKAGIADSDMHNQALAQMDRQAIAMQDQMRTNYLNEGLQAAGVAYGPMQSAIADAAKLDQALMQQQQSFMQTLATMYGSQQAPVNVGGTPQAGTPQSAGTPSSSPSGVTLSPSNIQDVLSLAQGLPSVVSGGGGLQGLIDSGVISGGSPIMSADYTAPASIFGG